MSVVYFHQLLGAVLTQKLVIYYLRVEADNMAST